MLNYKTFDPYHNSIRNAREDRILMEKRKERKKSEKFLDKKVYLTDFINLPEGLANILFISLFIVMPYIFGTVMIFISVAKINLYIYNTLNISFFFSWVIGYEAIATLLLLMIFATAIRYK